MADERAASATTLTESAHRIEDADTLTDLGRRRAP